MAFKYAFKREAYGLTASGKGWKARPDKVEQEDVNEAFYKNYTSNESIRWAKRFSKSCRVEYGHTLKGYIPVRITSVSPAGDIKIVASFRITWEA